MDGCRLLSPVRHEDGLNGYNYVSILIGLGCKRRAPKYVPRQTDGRTDRRIDVLTGPYESHNSSQVLVPFLLALMDG